MPCTMPTLTFNRTKQNERLKEIGDLLTHELDKIREAVLANQTPDFSAYDESWVKIIDGADQSLKNERSGPSDGVLTDADLLQKVEDLWGEYIHVKDEWRKDKCRRIRPLLARQQDAHRKEDLKRLAHTFIETGDMPMLRKVIDADPAYPLTEQLGFDPDDY